MANRTYTVTSPLGESALRFHRMEGTEELGRLFEYRLELLSDDHDIAFKDVLGQPMTIRVELSNGERFFHGHVAEFRYAGSAGRRALYRAVLRPWLWFLTRSADCRIFQDLTVPEIVKEVFRAHEFDAFEERFESTYRKRDYCVQYRETAFDFVSRLLEEEGIYYFFRHEKDKHTLVLCDAPSAHEAFSGYEELPFRDVDAKSATANEHVSAWQVSRHVQPGAFAHTDYEFGHPKAQLLEKHSLPGDHAHAKYEVFDYPGAFLEPESQAKGDQDLRDGSRRYAKIRAEELRAQHERFHGTADARGLAVGHLFQLTDHPRRDQNAEYLAVATQCEFTAEDYQSGGSGGEEPPFVCRFEAIAGKQPFRSARLTRRPVVQGPQTAVVVGPKGSGPQVHTDSFGRVKVHFHWDRHGEGDATSCWVRVSHNWAGNTWGAMFLPHVGQEVVVDFLEGDPDQPVITGRVNNKDQMPPEALPENKYKSIIRDHYGNELIFDGTPGEEHIRLRSPHHESGIDLGRSTVLYTNSNGVEYTWGNKHGGHLGFQSEITAGLKCGVMIGWTGEFSLASKTAVTLGVERSLTVSNKVAFTTGDEVEFNSGDFKKMVSKEIVLDSAESAFAVAGPADNAQLRLDGHKSATLLFSSAGNAAKAAVRSANDAAKKSVKTHAMVGLATQVASAVSFGMTDTKLANNSYKTAIMYDASASCLAAALALDALLTRAIRNCQTKAPDEPTPDAKIQLDANGIELHTSKGKKLTSYSGGDTEVWSQGNIRFMTEGSGEIQWDKLLVLNKSGMVQIKKGTFKHPSIEAK